MNFYSIETEVKYRKEQLDNALPKVNYSPGKPVRFQLNELYSKIFSQKTRVDSHASCECHCAC